MGKLRVSVDKPLIVIIALLIVAGCLIFASAAFGLLARGERGMSSVVFNHIVLGVGVGVVLMIIGMQIDYRKPRRWYAVAPYRRLYRTAFRGAENNRRTHGRRVFRGDTR